MKTQFLSALLALSSSIAFSQITLEHTFTIPGGGTLKTYSNSNNTFYYTLKSSNTFYSINIYNSDYSLRKTLDITPPADYISFSPTKINNYFISQYIFNTDDKLEFLIPFSKRLPAPNNFYPDQYSVIYRIYNEDGVILKEFEPKYYYPILWPTYPDPNLPPNTPERNEYNNWAAIELFHDSNSNKNKLKLLNISISGAFNTEIWNLGTSSTLGLTELNNLNGKMSAFPVPTNKTLNIVNPKSGADKLEIYDASGKILLSKNISASQNIISIDVENLPKGNYFYRIGNQSSKFIKN